MKPPFLKRLNMEDFSKLEEPSRKAVDQLSTVLNPFLANVTNAMTKNITIADNLTAIIKEVEFTTLPTSTSSATPVNASDVVVVPAGDLTSTNVQDALEELQSEITASGSSQWIDASGGRIYYNAGNVGIGTDNPTNKLQVSSSPGVGAPGPHLVVEQASGGAGATAYLDLYTFSAASTGYPGARIYAEDDGAVNSHIHFQTRLTGVGGALTDRMVIRSDGTLLVDGTTLVVDPLNNRVGINKIAPVSSLDVVGDAQISTNLQVDGGTLFVNATTHRVGLGTFSPASRLVSSVSGNTMGAIATTVFSGASGTAPLLTRLDLYTARGTVASQSAVQSGDEMGGTQARGFDGTTGSTAAAAITFTASENWSSSGHGAAIRFSTTTSGTTVMSERALFTNAGDFDVAGTTLYVNASTLRVGFGTATPTGKIAVLIVSTGTPTAVFSSISGASGTAPGRTPIETFTSRGTSATLAVLQSADEMGGIVGRGYDGVAASSAQVGVGFYTTQLWTTAAHGSEIRFSTTANGSLVKTDRIRLTHGGHIEPFTGFTNNIGSNSLPFDHIYGGGVHLNFHFDLLSNVRIDLSAKTNTYRSRLAAADALVSHAFSSIAALTNAGAKVAAFYRDDSVTEVASISRDGNFTTIGSATFTGGMTVDGTTLVVDAVNNRVGINQATPTEALHVIGNAIITGSVSPSSLIFPDATVQITASPFSRSGDDAFTNIIGTLGIGTIVASILSKLHVVNDSALTQTIWADSYFNGGSTPSGIVFRTARGSRLAPTAIQLNDLVSSVATRGRGATGFGNVQASIHVRATENWTDTAQGTLIAMSTTAPGGTSLTEKLFLDGVGNLNTIGKFCTGESTIYADAQLHTVVQSTTVQSQHNDVYYAAGVEGAGITLRSARGTQGAPTAVQANDLIGFLGTRGYGATGFSTQSRGSYRVFAAENWTDTAQGTYITLATTSPGTTTNVNRVTIDGSGNITLNNTGGRIFMTGGISIHSGTGDPNGVHTAEQGSMFLRTDGAFNSTLYIKTGGLSNIGWNPLN